LYHFTRHHIPGPKPVSAPLPGGVIQQCIDKLGAELSEQEAHSGPLQDKPQRVWQKITAHIHFDLNDNKEFPLMETTKKAATQTNATTMAQLVAPSRSVASKKVAFTNVSMSTIVSNMHTMITT
jgi:hypothetical protein